MLHSYKASHAETCLDRRSAVFIGDSVTRKLFFQFANILDPHLPTTVPDDDQKHADHHLRSASGTELTFFWDPFLNSSHVDALTARWQELAPHDASTKRQFALDCAARAKLMDQVGGQVLCFVWKYRSPHGL